MFRLVLTSLVTIVATALASDDILLPPTLAIGAEHPRARPGNELDKLSRGEGLVKKGHVDLFVAATAVWDLEPQDPRLWMPPLELGRTILTKTGRQGQRRIYACPAAYPNFATYLRRRNPRFTRTEVAYICPDPEKENPPILYRNESIQASTVVSPTGIHGGIIVSRGGVQTKKAIQGSVVLANGDVTAVTGLYDSVIVCDGDVTVTDWDISLSVIVARGNITAKRGATMCDLIAGGKVAVGKNYRVSDPSHNVIKENEACAFGFITFFELSTVGVDVKLDDKIVRVTTVKEKMPFATAGIKVGDKIVSVNGKKPESAESLRRLVRDALAIGDASVVVRRGEKTETLKVSLPE